MPKPEQQQQEPVRSVKETRSEPARKDLAKHPASPFRGAGKWALGVPIGGLGEDELIEMASALGNSSMLALIRGAAGVETAGPYRFGVEPAVCAGFSGGFDKAFNEIAPPAPDLMDSFGFGHISGAMTPFAVSAIRDRTAETPEANLFGESLGDAL